MAKERADYEVKVQGHLSDLGDTHGSNLSTLQSEKEAARAQLKAGTHHKADGGPEKFWKEEFRKEERQAKELD